MQRAQQATRCFVPASPYSPRSVLVSDFFDKRTYIRPFLRSICLCSTQPFLCSTTSIVSVCSWSPNIINPLSETFKKSFIKCWIVFSASSVLV